MKSRRGFLGALTAVSGAGLGLTIVAAPRAQSGGPSPAPKPTPAAKPPTPAALAVAATFRTFDSALTDTELTVIARNIDANRSAAAGLNRASKPLLNSDEMAARFAVSSKR